MFEFLFDCIMVVIKFSIGIIIVGLIATILDSLVRKIGG